MCEAERQMYKYTTTMGSDHNELQTRENEQTGESNASELTTKGIANTISTDAIEANAERLCDQGRRRERCQYMGGAALGRINASAETRLGR